MMLSPKHAPACETNTGAAGEAMNYELAKQLMDAGFPGSEVWYANTRLVHHDNGRELNILAELIETCGDGFYRLERLSDEHETIFYACNEDLSLVGSGLTPEEAVAHLWLALKRSP
jgi:hypothetical protein